MRAFDQLVQATVKQQGVNAPPGSPANGDAYIVGSAPTGAWAGQAGKIAVWSTEIAMTDTDTKVPAWEFYTPKEGWLAYAEQDDALMFYNGTAWTFDFKLAGIPHPEASGRGNQYDRRGQRIAWRELPGYHGQRNLYLDSGQDC